MGLGGSPAGDALPASDQGIQTQEILDEVLAALRRRLAAHGSALLRDVGTSRELSEQVRSILQDALGSPAPADALSAQVGMSRARKGIHPVESLHAADELFDVALPIVVRHCGSDGLEILSICQRLHQAIMSRIALASLPYVEYLLTKLHASREEERHRISRELHDRVGHGMAVALQHLDMYQYFRRIGDPRAEREFTAGLTSLDEALLTVRHMSTELRRSVGEDGIKTAIESYLRDNVPGGIRALLEITGDTKMLPAPVSEELYLIMREACRNALRHGQPDELRLTMAITESDVTAVVSDNGRGFSVADTPAGGGLPSMTERVELLNGMLMVSSAIGEGTTVTVRVPLASAGSL